MSQSPFDASVNPYQAPSSAGAEGPATGPGGLDPAVADRVSWRAVDMLRQTRPWARLMSVVQFLFAGILLVVGGVASVAMLVGACLPGAGGAFEFGVMSAYFIMGLLYLPPAIYLFRYASRIVLLEQFASFSNLEKALSAQKSFWRYVGIFSLVIVALYAVFFAGIAVFAAFSALSR